LIIFSLSLFFYFLEFFFLFFYSIPTVFSTLKMSLSSSDDPIITEELSTKSSKPTSKKSTHSSPISPDKYEAMLAEAQAQKAQVAELQAQIAQVAELKAQLAQAHAAAASIVPAWPLSVAPLDAPPPRVISLEDSFGLSLRLLSGSKLNLAICIALALTSLSCTLSAVGILSGASKNVSHVDRAYYILSVLLLSAGVLQLSRTVRDLRLAEVFPNELLAKQLSGTKAAAAMTVLSVIISIVLIITVVIGLSANSGLSTGESVSLMLLSITFLLTSLVNLAKVWRDRFDAAFFVDAFKRNPERLTEFIAAVYLIESSSGLFYFINVVSALASTVAVLSAIFSSGDSLSMEFKIILALCEVFMISAAINMTKLVRDNLEVGAIKPSFQWAAVTTAMIIVALFAVFGIQVVICIKNTVSSRLCSLLFIGTFWVLGSVVMLSKIARDIDEKKRDAELNTTHIARGVQIMQEAKRADEEGKTSNNPMYALHVGSVAIEY
jgi:hypothetical protein